MEKEIPCDKQHRENTVLCLGKVATLKMELQEALKR